MKIVVLDRKSLGLDVSIDPLNQYGEVTAYMTTKNEEVPERVKDADVVVVNISQGMNIKELNIDKDILKKAVFIIGKYDEESEENVAIIRQKYGIDRKNIAVIPYNIHFHDAIHGGKIVSFLSKCMNPRGDSEDITFINNVFLATDMVLRKAGYDEERK